MGIFPICFPKDQYFCIVKLCISNVMLFNRWVFLVIHVFFNVSTYITLCWCKYEPQPVVKVYNWLWLLSIINIIFKSVAVYFVCIALNIVSCQYNAAEDSITSEIRNEDAVCHQTNLFLFFPIDTNNLLVNHDIYYTLFRYMFDLY